MSAEDRDRLAASVARIMAAEAARREAMTSAHADLAEAMSARLGHSVTVTSNEVIEGGEPR